MIIASLVAPVGRSDWVLGKNIFSGGGEEWYRSAVPIPLRHPAPHLPHLAADWRSCAWPTGGAALSLSICPFPSLSRSATFLSPFSKGQRSCLATRTNQQVIAPVCRDRWPRSATTTSLAASARASGSGSEIRLPRPSFFFHYLQVFPFPFIPCPSGVSAEI